MGSGWVVYTERGVIVVWAAQVAYVHAMDDVLSAMRGSLFGFSLIVAIGPQNAFVLRQGLLKHNVAAVVIVCAASDALLIALGVGGVGAAIADRSWLAQPMYLTGALFLTGYGAISARRVLREQGSLLEAASPRSLKRVVAATLAFTWLNPHVYLDTVVLLGVVANSTSDSTYWFAAGAMLSSVIWFSALGFGARALRPIFATPLAARILDLLIAVVMFAMAATLFVHGTQK